ncbi:VOC family protein [Mycobacterium marseillense]|uniref:Dioxygenase n=2 Tax=Mycobacterium marseillense TaxID=701042 RepID=A0AAC9VRD0_9MYCO|nr:VOC family protein [Mycobacterium marseillense]ASW88833.1 dioxygenase [Mycobacterium marseillense]MCA2262199.1 VOC family protein [Mycobacterium marseillense]MCV7405132.1 VOC family protein [Mycobacterium marseillense]MDM3974263.1 VOC family protein [Mycobacterium marseillense]OBJ69558.1 dioxygenase [Mycobacterium marseillense]
MRLDHVVLWTKDPRAAMDFYSKVVGLAPVRFAEFEAGQAPFPSVRVSEDSIIDLMPLEMASGAASSAVAEGSAGRPVNHVCLALSKADYDALEERLQAAGVDTSVRLHHSFGARGWSPHTYYFADPDGNVLEARYYE